MEEVLQLDNNALIYERLNNVFQVNKFIQNEDIHSFIDFGIYLYKQYYYIPINNILETFPEDFINENGLPFWSGKKLQPTLFDIDILSKEYFTSILDIISPNKQEEFNMFWDDTYYRENYFKENLLSNKNIQINKLVINEKKEMSETLINDSDIHNVKQKIMKLNTTKQNTTTLGGQYDKDNNIHLKAMTNIVNLRAKTYGIQEIDTLETKLISGRIIPALSTTTSVIAGFVIIDILKYLSKNNKFTEVNINLGTNNYSIYDAFHPKPTYNNMYSEEYNTNIKTIPVDFTTWSKIVCSGKKDLINTNVELATYLYDTYEIKPNMVCYKSHIIYNSDNPKEEDLKYVYERIEKKYKEYLEFNIINYDNEGVPIESPSIIYHYL